MNAIQIIMFIMSIISLIIGLLLSNSGSTGGLASLSGQDLEIFKKTKDRGLIKVLQIVMFVIMILFLILGLVFHFTQQQ
ncbi:preprotein translocase subunit SecG [Mycoplasmoides pirum]|uniref:preprotein translocase subunit SecG n=1 Tax=Mycoplasmoides pirum TaxID=2122 RepID=UPI00047F1C2B|nr:preprotein translocase subunit SecG [Mycoplasmoides pirum]